MHTGEHAHLEDVPDACPAHELAEWHVLRMALQQGTKALGVAAQHLQQRGTAAAVCAQQVSGSPGSVIACYKVAIACCKVAHGVGVGSVGGVGYLE